MNQPTLAREEEEEEAKRKERDSARNRQGQGSREARQGDDASTRLYVRTAISRPDKSKK